ncbi:MAG: cyclic nucleotide-binding domain-containing protein [Actinomycetota bacterium]
MTGKASSAILDRRHYEAGKTIFAQGQPGDVAFVVETGEVGIYKDIDGEEVKLGTVRPGGIFGEMAVIDGSPRMASAIAETATVLVRVPKAVFEQKLAGCDTFIRGLIAIFLTNIRSCHRLYAKKPRSLQDMLRLLDSYTCNLRTYVNEISVDEFSPDMAAALADLEGAVRKVRDASTGHRDRRSSVMTDDELRGVTPRSILDKG